METVVDDLSMVNGLQTKFTFEKKTKVFNCKTMFSSFLRIWRVVHNSNLKICSLTVSSCFV